MLDKLTEIFLHEYFLYEAILGKYFSPKIFDFLQEVFCLKENDDLISLVNSETIKEVQTEADYKRYRRIKQYNELTYQPKLLDEEADVLISLKGKAIETATQCSLFASNEMTRTWIERNIHQYAKQGHIVAMRVLGTLMCAGVFVEQNIQKGKYYLEKATQWGDALSGLSLLKYDEKSRKETLIRINACIQDTPYQFLSDVLQNEYGIEANEANEQILLLKKAFASNKLKQEHYEPLYARILFSSLMSIKDKEKIVFSENKEIISEACDLPLKLKGDHLLINEAVLEEIPIVRQEEQHHLLIGLKNNDLRAANNYKPIGIYSDEEEALDIYTRYLTKMLKQNHIERIDVADLKGSDFEPTKNHAFVRYAEEGKNNIYLLVLKGKIEEFAIEEIINFLRSDKRKRFYLNHPAIHLDLSQILPICICDKENADQLKNYVEFIKIANIKSAEKPNVIKDMLQEKSKSYHISFSTIEEQALNGLNLLSLESVDKTLDKVLKEYRIQNEGICLTMEMIKPYIEDKHSGSMKRSYGFGGAFYENN